MSPESDLFISDRPSADISPVPSSGAPLAARMRPETLDDIAGQEHLLAEGRLLSRTIKSDRIVSLIFYGPPGSGKTTLAHVIARVTQARFIGINAVTSNAQQLRGIIQEARRLRGKTKTILFIDELHRFNKAQQDILMPDVESGSLILIGATTHNPSFSINGPLLSRSLIFELKSLEEDALIRIMKRALKDRKRGLGAKKVCISDEALRYLARNAAGDARRALNALEVGVLTTRPDSEGVIQFGREVAHESCQKKIVYYDGDEDYHYDTISALIKSIRGSDPDAAVYWLAKMLYAGEDPRFIVRRLLILASEDIGNADPQALMLASSGLQAVEFVGMPESRIILSQIVTYLALAPKSNASYLAIQQAAHDIQHQPVEDVPNHLRDSSYPGAKRMAHGDGYQYSHRHQPGEDQQIYRAGKKRYYEPRQIGFEQTLSKRLSALRAARAQASK